MLWHCSSGTGSAPTPRQSRLLIRGEEEDVEEEGEDVPLELSHVEDVGPVYSKF